MELTGLGEFHTARILLICRRQCIRFARLGAAVSDTYFQARIRLHSFRICPYASLNDDGFPVFWQTLLPLSSRLMAWGG